MITRLFLGLLICAVFTACSSRPVLVSDVRHPPLTAGEKVRITVAPDEPAPVGAKRFAFTIRQIGVGSQKDLNGAIDDGVRNARSLGANLIHLTISEPEARRQKVEVSFYRIDQPTGGTERTVPPVKVPTTGAPTTR